MAQNEPQRKETPPGPSPNSPSLLFEYRYQCRSGKFIRLANRIEKNRFGSENRIFLPELECSSLRAGARTGGRTTRKHSLWPQSQTMFTGGIKVDQFLQWHMTSYFPQLARIINKISGYFTFSAHFWIGWVPMSFTPSQAIYVCTFSSSVTVCLCVHYLQVSIISSRGQILTATTANQLA